jgi:hypothetical protein
MFRRVCSTLLVACLVAGLPVQARAQDPVLDIVTKMKEALEPTRPSIRQVVITTSAEGETARWMARDARKQFPDGKRMVMVLLEPADVKGNAYPVWEPQEKPSTVWMYMPFLRRVREFVHVDAYQHFLGTDFTFANVGFARLHPHYRLLSEEEHGGKMTYKIEEAVPKERAYYSRVITWVSKDSLPPVQRDYYDVGGALLKTEFFEEEVIDGMPTPIRIQMVVRMPYGDGVRALEHHSESREAYFAHTPGLKMVIPSGPRTARALLVSAIRDPDPVIFFEPKLIYRAFREEIPEEEETLPIGKSRIVREGQDLTMISYGAMLRRTLEAAEQLAEEDGVEAEVIDLLTISPLDDEQFTESARKTGREVIVHEAPRSFGPGAEIIARLVEKSFYYLEAPVQRVTRGCRPSW